MAAYFRQRVCGDRALQDGKRSKALISAFIKKVALAPLYHRMAICIYAFVTSIPSAAASTNWAIDESALTYFMWILLTAIALSGWLIVYLKVSASRRQYRKERADAQQFSELCCALKSLTDTFNLAGLCVVLWDDATSQPKIYGRLSNFQVNCREKSAQLDFDSWLTHRARATLEHALDELRSNGHSFYCVVETTDNKLISASGFISYGNALVIFQDVTQLHNESVLQEKRMSKLTAKFDLIAALLNTLAEPCWLYDEQGLTWQNDAYLQAVGTDSTKRDLQHQLFADIVGAFRRSEQSAERVKTVANINGERRHFMVNQVSQSSNSAGIAIDVTENNNLRTEVTRLNQGYSETLDLLPTAVAIFDRNMKLNFFNQAFAALWPLDTSFLESEPSHALILDKLREKGLIAEQPLWRQWKEDLFAAYHTLETTQHIWNLPDGRTLRVLAHPHPQGGVIWLYENLTEKIALETRYNALIKRQGETLDHLSEGVVVFGMDGRLRLSNPAFAKLLNLPAQLAIEGTHIQTIATSSSPFLNEIWPSLTASITGFSEKRDGLSGRVEANQTVLDYATVSLPDGQTLVTFVDVTANVRYALALKDKNDALERADKLRSDFVEHVSYELRTPLTNIIGFTELLATRQYGELNERQSAYISHIGSQSAELLHIVNDILDLATVDAGIMELDITKVDIQNSINEAVSRVQDRLLAKNVTTEIDIAAQLPPFYADSSRLRQVLVNILANAANFAPPASHIRIQVYADKQSMIFAIHDEGSGIPQSILANVFKRFTAKGHHGARSGAGLGLSIVKSFVELHGGSVQIETGCAQGTTVICCMPLRTAKEEEPRRL